MLLFDNAQHLFLGDERVTQIWTGVPTKNLLRPDLQIYTGLLNSYNSWGTTGYHVFIPIEVPGTYYFTQNQGTSNGIQIAVANENKYVISGSRDSNTSSSVDVKQLSIDTTQYPTAKYLVVCWYYDDFEWQMVLLNDSSTTYIPFEIEKKQIFDWKPYQPLEWIQTSEETGGWELDYVPQKEHNLEITTAQLWAENDGSVGYDSMKGVVYSAGNYYTGYYRVSRNQYNYNSYFTYGYFMGDSNNKHVSNMQGNKCAVLWEKGYTKTVKMERSRAYVGTKSNQHDPGTYLPTDKLMIGGQPNNVTGSGWVFGPQQFQGCTITDRTTGELIINVIPVLRKSDNTPCLYDTVNDRFYTTTGSKPTIYEVKS